MDKGNQRFMPDNEINPVGMRHSIFQSDHIPTSLTLDGETGQGGRFHRTTQTRTILVSKADRQRGVHHR